MRQDLIFEERAREAVARATGMRTAGMPVQRLAGHASSRSYWRVGTYGSGSHAVMVVPPDGTPDEATTGDPPAETPFVNVQRYLRRIGVRVPEIIAWEEQSGCMVLEDLGDETLATRLAGGAMPGPLYETAIDQLAWMRWSGERHPDPSCVAFARSFDHELYHWELMHFVEWALQSWKGSKLSPTEQKVVGRHFDAICRTLAAEATGFTHRDYQSRNIMLHDGEQVVIDFQDALLGPCQYDLVALLRDSKVVLDQELIDRMLRRYLERLSALGGPELPFEPFRELFDLLTVHRKLKDAGRYIFIDRVKRVPGFLVSLPTALKYVREAFVRRPDLAELQEVLAAHVPELAP